MNGWELLPTLVVRTAGFPWQLVEELRFARTADAVAACAELDRQAQTLRVARPPARLTRGQAARLRTGRPLPPESPLPATWLDRWNALALAIQRERERLDAAVEADTRDSVTAMEKLVSDSRFRDAVVCASPGIYRDLRRDGVAAPRLRRQVGALVQRLAAKCETMSFFGPINYGQVESGAGGYRWDGHLACASRRAFVSAWLFQSLLVELSGRFGTADFLVPRRKARRRWPAGDVVVAGADGRSTLGDIADRAGIAKESAAQALVAAMRAGSLTHDLEPPASVVDPLRWLAARSADAAIGEVAALLDRYPGAGADEKLGLQDRLAAMGEVGMVPARTGRFYHDRLPVHEAAVGTLRVRVGGDLAWDLSRAVIPALDLLAANAEITRRQTNRAVAARLGRGRCPLLAAMRVCADVPVVHSDRLATAIADVLESTGPTADLDLAGRLPEAVAAPPELPVLGSVDVMVATDDLARYQAGRTPLVLSDVHDAPLLTPWALQFHPDAERLLAERDEAIVRALGEVRAISVVARRTTGLPSWELPGLVLELGPASSTATTITLDELWVHSDGERAVLRGPSHDGDLLWHNGELDSGLHTAFALPRLRALSLVDVPYVPRLRWGNVVLARRRWRVHPADLEVCGRRPSEAQRLASVHQRWQERDWPGRCFAKVPHERKPIYVDIACPTLLDGLHRLAAEASWVDLTEVLPSPEQLWLRDGDLRFAAELRCVYLRPGQGVS